MAEQTEEKKPDAAAQAADSKRIHTYPLIRVNDFENITHLNFCFLCLKTNTEKEGTIRTFTFYPMGSFSSYDFSVLK